MASPKTTATATTATTPSSPEHPRPSTASTKAATDASTTAPPHSTTTAMASPKTTAIALTETHWPFPVPPDFMPSIAAMAASTTTATVRPHHRLVFSAACSRRLVQMECSAMFCRPVQMVPRRVERRSPSTTHALAPHPLQPAWRRARPTHHHRLQHAPPGFSLVAEILEPHRHEWG